MEATIDTIRDSSDLVWDLVLAYEEGADVSDIWTRAAGLSAADRVILEEEIRDIDRKRRAGADEIRAMVRAECQARGVRAAVNAADAIRSGAAAYEDAILARQERA